MPGVFHFVGLPFRLAAGLLTAVAVLASLGSLSAQQVSVQDRAQLLRSSSTAPTDPYSDENGVDNERAVESPNDAYIGEQEILKRVQRYEPFTASVATPWPQRPRRTRRCLGFSSSVSTMTCAACIKGIFARRA